MKKILVLFLALGLGTLGLHAQTARSPVSSGTVSPVTLRQAPMSKPAAS